MARSDKVKGPSVDRDRKIQKLNKMIKAKERELRAVEQKTERAKDQVAKGDLSKADFQRLHISLGRDRKSIRGAITRLEGSRLNRERRIKEKAEEKEEKLRVRQQKREERDLERERKREEKKAKGSKGKGKDDEDD